MIVFRKIENKDIDNILALFEQYPLQFPRFVINRYPERWNNYFEKLSNSEYWVATINNEVVGHAGFFHNQDVDLYEIVGVVVSSHHQRKGIGRGLLDTVCGSIRDRGKNKVILYTLGHPGNEGTISFYRSSGYIETNYEKDYFRSGYSRVTFLKELETEVNTR
jgi:ribosomal protein S18 acetylase RimI-like enzyme